MPFQAAVTSTINLQTTSATSANFGSTCFGAVGSFSANRVTAFSSFTEVQEHAGIDPTSNAYKALRLAFSVPSGTAVPVYLAKIDFDDSTLTASELKDNNVYSFKITTVNETTNVQSPFSVSFTSGTGATLAEISAGLDAAFTTAGVTNATLVDNLDGSVTISKAAGYTFIIESLEDLESTYTSTESAADFYAAVLEEAEEDFYFLATENHTESWVLALASEVEASESSNFPKQYHVSVQEADSLLPLPDPAVDTLGKLKELNYNRTHAQWHHEADEVFPEMSPSPYNGKYYPGSTTWKFIPIVGGLSVARDPVTLKELSTAKLGYILDRNASVFSTERGVPFYHGGRVASSEWVDVIRAKDNINNEIEVRLLNLLLNQKGSKLTFGKGDKNKVKAVIDGILSEQVQRGVLNGYIPAVVPDTVSFEDQASRILKDVEWTGYLAGAIHTIVVSGNLTYSDQPLV